MFASALLDVVKSYVAGIDAARAGVRPQAIRQNSIWDSFIFATADTVPLGGNIDGFSG